MPTYSTKLTSKREIARDTMEFRFEKPLRIEFNAGNSFDWTLINPPETDKEGDLRQFSLVAAPFENYIGFATRMRDTAFKRTIKNAKIGFEIKIEGPFGSFQLDTDTSKRAVLLTGGIGITPFMSMIKQATYDKSTHKMYLFYSDKTPGDMAFLLELQQLEKQNTNFRLIPIMTRVENGQWDGETGHIDKNMLEKYLQTLDNSIYYIAGPPQMTSSMREILLANSISEGDIRWEEFSGY